MKKLFLKRLMGVFLDWTIAMIVISAFARVMGFENLADLGVWRFVMIGGFLYLIIQILRYKITGKLPW